MKEQNLRLTTGSFAVDKRDDGCYAFLDAHQIDAILSLQISLILTVSGKQRQQQKCQCIFCWWTKANQYAQTTRKPTTRR